jgi:nucleotide-binding universal stress UspA family protein
MAGMKALIPLDGTDLSESAYSMLPLAKTLGFERVELVSVWEHAWEEHHMEEQRGGEIAAVAEKGRSAVDAYLAQQAEHVTSLGFEAGTTVRVGKAAEETLQAAEELGVDLIAIATHGRDGLDRFRLGSVADKIIRNASCPTLVIGPNVSSHLAPYDVKRILVPLDGSGLAEEALPVASWIARQEKAEIDLVRVVSITPVSYDESMGFYSMDLLTAMEDAARTYLDRIAVSLAPVQTQTALLVGSAGEQILDYMKERPADLVVLASRGRAGLLRAALGSVADRMLHGPCPVLILRPEEELKGRLLEAAAGQRGAA